MQQQQGDKVLHVRQIQSLDAGGVQQLILLGDQDLQSIHKHLFAQHTVWQGCREGGVGGVVERWMDGEDKE